MAFAEERVEEQAHDEVGDGEEHFGAEGVEQDVGSCEEGEQGSVAVRVACVRVSEA